MAGDKKITFYCDGAKIIVNTENGKVKVKGSIGDYDEKELINIFKAAVNKVGSTEHNYLDDLKTIFSKSGTSLRNDQIDDGDMKKLMSFDDKGSTYENIQKEIYNERYVYTFNVDNSTTITIDTKAQKITSNTESLDENLKFQLETIAKSFAQYEAKLKNNFTDDGNIYEISTTILNSLIEPKTNVGQGVSGSIIHSQSPINTGKKGEGVHKNGNKASGAATTQTINNLKKALQENATENFTKLSDTVKAGDSLWKLAKNALIDEGTTTPNSKQIIERCALIAKANNLTKTDKNGNLIILLGRQYKVGFEGAPKNNPNENPKVLNPENVDKSSNVFNQGVNDVSNVEAKKHDFKYISNDKLEDPVTEGWTSITEYSTPSDITTGRIEKYTKTEGEDGVQTTSEKFVYTTSDDKVTFEALTEEELKEKITKFNNAVDTLSSTAQDQTSEEDKALEEIISLGTKSALLFAHEKMRDRVNPKGGKDLYINLTEDLLRFGDYDIVEKITGGGPTEILPTIVNYYSEVQDIVGQYMKDLEEKYNNSTITQDELKILTRLRPANDEFAQVGVKIAKDENFENKEGASITAAAEMQYMTDKHGNNYWQVTEGGDVYKAQSAEKLNSFLNDLKAEGADKNLIFRTYMTEENADHELAVSLAGLANKLNIDVNTLLEVIETADLDVLYALEYDHLSEENPDDQGATIPVCTQVYSAISERKEELINTRDQRNDYDKKYFEKVQGFDLSGSKTIMESVDAQTQASLLKNQDVNVNDPQTKASVQKLLLTRDAEVVKTLITKETNSNTFECDETLFANDPVALKTLAAIFKELRDKEKVGTCLSAEEIALKEVIRDYAVVQMDANLQDGNKLRFDGDGNLAIYDRRVAVNSQLVDLSPYGNDVLDDLLMSKDKYILAGWNFHFVDNKDQALKYINLDTVDAELLSYLNFGELPGHTSFVVNDEEEIQNAYINKAKQQFEFSNEEINNPADARYLATILDKINDFNLESSGDEITAILDQFFIKETTDDETNTVKLKDFRRFTYEEMEGLVAAVDKYGTPEQMLALIENIKFDDIGPGRSAEILQKYGRTPDLQNKYKEFINNLTSQQEVLDFIDLLGEDIELAPYQEIYDKFNDINFVTNHLGYLYDQDTILRKQTLADKLSGSILNLAGSGFAYGWGQESASRLGRHLSSDDVKKYLELQNINYEYYNSKSEIEKQKNIERLNELWDENEDEEFRLAMININIKRNGLYDESLINKILESKNIEFLDRLFVQEDYSVKLELTQSNIENMYNLIKNEDPNDGKKVYWASNILGYLTDEKYYNGLTDEQKSTIYPMLSQHAKIKVLNHSVSDKTEYTNKIKELGIKKMNFVSQDLIKTNLLEDSYHIVKKGETLDRIIFEYINNNKDKVEKINKLQTQGYSFERIKNALLKYIREYRIDIAKDLGIDNPDLIKEGQILDLSKIKWEDHQPTWLHAALNY